MIKSLAVVCHSTHPQLSTPLHCPTLFISTAAPLAPRLSSLPITACIVTLPGNTSLGRPCDTLGVMVRYTGGGNMVPFLILMGFIKSTHIVCSMLPCSCSAVQDKTLKNSNLDAFGFWAMRHTCTRSNARNAHSSLVCLAVSFAAICRREESAQTSEPNAPRMLSRQYR